MKVGQRREREIAHARTDIVEAAIRAFARVGLNNATMQDIAREAGYTAASLYTYFKSKQEIVDAMVTLLTDEYVHVFDEPIPSVLSFRQRFELLLQRQLELAEKRHNVFVGFLSDHTNESMCASDETGRAFHDNFERRIERLASWLTTNATSDDLGGHAPELLARTLFGMAFGLMHRWGEKAEHEPFIQYAPLITDLFFDGVSGKTKPGARKK
ncbi:MAG TPA: TetR/AcrR family transcriptional regulator [Polyangia bacterium]